MGILWSAVRSVSPPVTDRTRCLEFTPAKNHADRRRAAAAAAAKDVSSPANVSQLEKQLALSSPIRIKSTQGVEYFLSCSDIIRQLECPVCNELMVPPIAVCKTGHSLCNSCRMRLDECPTCRRRFLADTRNFCLEAMSQFIFVSCQAQKCNETYAVGARQSHERVCMNRSVSCPFKARAYTNCLWFGAIAHLEKHLDISHASAIYKMKSNQHQPSINVLNGFSIVIYEHKVMQISMTRDTELIYFCFRLYGSKRDAEHYKVVVEMRSKSGLSNQHERLVHSDLDDVEMKCFPLIAKDLFELGFIELDTSGSVKFISLSFYYASVDDVAKRVRFSS